jgi:DNA-binding transcriptional LysR family regulator
MELIQLLSFHEIVKTESFSKASRNVFRSQSALSHQIKNLEKELGVKLFDRIGKTIKVKEEGRILFDIIDKFVYDLEDLRKILIDVKKSKVGNLTIASSSSIMTYVLPDIVRRFINQFPGVNLKLIACSFFSEIQSLVLEGKIDFGIGIASDQMLPRRINYVSWKLFDTILIAPKGHSLSYRKAVRLGDIAPYPHIIYRKGSRLSSMIEEVYARNKIDYKIIMEVDVAENIKSYVEMGFGVGILSSVTLTTKDKNRFAILNVSNLFGKVEIGIYYRNGQYISTTMKQFMKLFAPELLNRIISPT